MEAGLKKAISVPMSLAKCVCNLWEPLKELATIGNFGTKSDLQVTYHSIYLFIIIYFF